MHFDHYRNEEREEQEPKIMTTTYEIAVRDENGNWKVDGTIARDNPQFELLQKYLKPGTRLQTPVSAEQLAEFRKLRRYSSDLRATMPDVFPFDEDEDKIPGFWYRLPGAQPADCPYIGFGVDGEFFVSEVLFGAGKEPDCNLRDLGDCEFVTAGWLVEEINFMTNTADAAKPKAKSKTCIECFACETDASKFSDEVVAAGLTGGKSTDIQKTFDKNPVFNVRFESTDEDCESRALKIATRIRLEREIEGETRVDSLTFTVDGVTLVLRQEGDFCCIKQPNCASDIVRHEIGEMSGDDSDVETIHSAIVKFVSRTRSAKYGARPVGLGQWALAQLLSAVSINIEA